MYQTFSPWKITLPLFYFDIKNELFIYTVAAADMCCVNTDHLRGRCRTGGAMCQEARAHRSANI